MIKSGGYQPVLEDLTDKDLAKFGPPNAERLRSLRDELGGNSQYVRVKTASDTVSGFMISVGFIVDAAAQDKARIEARIGFFNQERGGFSR